MQEQKYPLFVLKIFSCTCVIVFFFQTPILCVDPGVDLSCIVKAVPTGSSTEKQEEQTHEVLQVSLELFTEHTLLIVKVSKISLCAHVSFHS